MDYAPLRRNQGPHHLGSSLRIYNGRNHDPRPNSRLPRRLCLRSSSACCRSASTGILELPSPLGSGSNGIATGISDDGIVAVNTGTAPLGYGGSYFWSKSTGPKFLPPLPGDNGTSAAGVNRLGQIVGTSSSAFGKTGVIWDHGQT